MEHSLIFHFIQAIHGTGEPGSGGAAKALRKVGLKSKGLDATAGDETLEEERMTYTRDGQKVPGFADAVVPTLEETVVQEHIAPKPQQANGSPIRDKKQHANGSPEQARTEDGELYGAPADASKSLQYDDEPPHERSGVVQIFVKTLTGKIRSSLRTQSTASRRRSRTRRVFPRTSSISSLLARTGARCPTATFRRNQFSASCFPDPVIFAIKQFEELFGCIHFAPDHIYSYLSLFSTYIVFRCFIYRGPFRFPTYARYVTFVQYQIKAAC
jgi:hypothetical protein